MKETVHEQYPKTKNHHFTGDWLWEKLARNALVVARRPPPKVRQVYSIAVERCLLCKGPRICRW